MNGTMMGGAARALLGAGAAYGLLAVALSAWAAHGAASLEPARLAMLGQGIAMQGWHALALLACAALAERRPLALWAGAIFALGTLLFCGGVYAAVAGVRLGPVAPIGGTLLMLGWLVLLVAAMRR